MTGSTIWGKYLIGNVSNKYNKWCYCILTYLILKTINTDTALPIEASVNGFVLDASEDNQNISLGLSSKLAVG